MNPMEKTFKITILNKTLGLIWVFWLNLFSGSFELFYLYIVFLSVKFSSKNIMIDVDMQHVCFVLVELVFDVLLLFCGILVVMYVNRVNRHLSQKKSKLRTNIWDITANTQVFKYISVNAFSTCIRNKHICMYTYVGSIGRQPFFSSYNNTFWLLVLTTSGVYLPFAEVTVWPD